MSSISLTPHRIEKIEPRGKSFSVRDGKVQGLNLCVTPKGSKTWFVRSMCRGETMRRRIGFAADLDIDEARAKARDIITAFQREATARSRLGPDSSFRLIAKITFERRARRWKRNTMKVNRDYLEILLPKFGEMPIGSITHQHVQDWYDGLHDTPATATRAAAVLSAIMTEAEDLECRPEISNPVKGLRRYKRRVRNRAPTREELERLGLELMKQEKKHPVETAYIRLLALTGCRMSEILQLKWQEYRHGNLYLEDSKTGPKTVFLSPQARAIINGLRTKRSKWVFPAKRGDRPRCYPKTFWDRVRRQAGLEHLRLHDLRHAYASIALSNGVSLPMVGILLGHGQPETTMRYVHLDDAAMVEAATTATAGMTTNKECNQ